MLLSSSSAYSSRCYIVACNGTVVGSSATYTHTLLTDYISAMFFWDLDLSISTDVSDFISCSVVEWGRDLISFACGSLSVLYAFVNWALGTVTAIRIGCIVYLYSSPPTFMVEWY